MNTNIKINGQPAALNLPPWASFGQVMGTIRDQTKTPGVRILRVRLNGEEITGKSWDSHLGLGLDEITDLEVETGLVSDLARETLGSLDEFIGGLIKELQRSAEQLRLGQSPNANDSLARALDGIQILGHTSPLVERGLGFDARGSNGDPINQKLARLEPILEDMFTAQKDGDVVLLADLIEYELIPYFQDRSKVVQGWSERAYA